MVNQMKWLPIETAPKDGTPILVYQPVGGFYSEAGRIGVVSYGEDGFGQPDMWCAVDCCDGVTTYNPTHWMPLPEAPK